MLRQFFHELKRMMRTKQLKRTVYVMVLYIMSMCTMFTYTSSSSFSPSSLASLSGQSVQDSLSYQHAFTQSLGARSAEYTVQAMQTAVPAKTDTTRQPVSTSQTADTTQTAPATETATWNLTDKVSHSVQTHSKTTNVQNIKNDTKNISKNNTKNLTKNNVKNATKNDAKNEAKNDTKNDTKNEQVTSVSIQETGDFTERLIHQAKIYLGVPYRFGATYDQDGSYHFDCSAYTKRVYGDLGIQLPRTTAKQAKLGTPVKKEDLQVGDLVFFTTRKDRSMNHDGIYIGDGKFIHASPAGGKGVQISDLTSGYWQNAYLYARRLPDANISHK